MQHRVADSRPAREAPLPSPSAAAAMAAAAELPLPLPLRSLRCFVGDTLLTRAEASSMVWRCFLCTFATRVVASGYMMSRAAILCIVRPLPFSFDTYDLQHAPLLYVSAYGCPEGNFSQHEQACSAGAHLGSCINAFPNACTFTRMWMGVCGCLKW